MKKTVWTFGLLAGAVLSATMLATMPFSDRIGLDNMEIIGYTSIIAAFQLIFFGIRSYRDSQAGRPLSFGRAFVVGVLINIVASSCYAATWEYIYRNITPDFWERYSDHVAEKDRAAGKSEQEIKARRAKNMKYREMARNPLVNAAFAFLEPFTVGLIVSLVSAGILRRKSGVAVG